MCLYTSGWFMVYTNIYKELIQGAFQHTEAAIPLELPMIVYLPITYTSSFPAQGSDNHIGITNLVAVCQPDVIYNKERIVKCSVLKILKVSCDESFKY